MREESGLFFRRVGNKRGYGAVDPFVHYLTACRLRFHLNKKFHLEHTICCSIGAANKTRMQRLSSNPGIESYSAPESCRSGSGERFDIWRSAIFVPDIAVSIVCSRQKARSVGREKKPLCTALDSITEKRILYADDKAPERYFSAGVISAAFFARTGKSARRASAGWSGRGKSQR